MKCKYKNSKRRVEKETNKKRGRQAGRGEERKEKKVGGGGGKGENRRGWRDNREIIRKLAEDRKIKITKKLSRWTKCLKAKRR